MTLILTNDDGIDAPGLRSLQQAVEEEVLIVAPKLPHSGCSHQATTHRPLQVEQRSSQAFAIDGTPVDCTRLALHHLHAQGAGAKALDRDSANPWVLSGINAGGNLGADVYVSGTVAAVREAALNRVRGIAISHYIHRGRAIDWDRATHLTRKVLDKLFPLPLEPGTFWNVNLPHLEAETPDPDLVFCSLCSQPLPVSYRIEGNTCYYNGDYGNRLRDAGSDVEVCFSGHIAITLMTVIPSQKKQ